MITTWNKELYQQFESIVMGLSSVDSAKRVSAYKQYFEMKRLFTNSVWDEYLGKVEMHREKCGGRSLKSLLEDVKTFLVKRINMNDPGVLVEIPSEQLNCVVNPIRYLKVEQLSLF